MKRLIVATVLAALVGVTATAQDKAPPAPAVKDPELRAELVRRMKAEQDARFEMARLHPGNQPFTPADRERPEIKAAVEKMQQIDRDNLAWLKGVVAAKGWPTKSMAG